MQQDKLQSQLRFAAEHVPYYRRLGLSTNLRDFPVLKRLALQQNFEQLASPLAQQRKAWVLNSSGSSGIMIRVLRDMQAQAWSTACAWRGDCWGGRLSPESRQVTLLSNVSNIVGGRRTLSPLGSWLHNRYVLDGMRLNPNRARELLKAIGELKPEILSGYPSVLLPLARIGIQQELKPPALRKVIPTAESCSNEEAAEIEHFFQAPVRQRYGSHEFSTMAHQCELGNWHWHSETLLVEVLDASGQIRRDGTGSLLCTSLVNQSFPLVRYEIGDEVDLTAIPCKCGRGLPAFGGIRGRTQEHAVLPDGSIISSHAFLAPMRRLPLLQYQLIQEDEERLRLLVVVSRPLTSAEQTFINATFNELHGGQLSQSIEEVDELQRGPNGKLMRMISRLRKSH